MSVELRIAAVVAVLAMIVYAHYWRRRVARPRPPPGVDVANGVQAAVSKPPPGVQERRGDQEFLNDLLKQLATIREDYIRFGRRVIVAIAIVAVAVTAALVVGGFALDDANEASSTAQQSSSDTLALAASNRVLLRRVDDLAEDAKREAARAAAALCALRSDLEKRAQRSEEFLRQNPAGIPGVPVELLQQSTADVQSTIRSLRVLSCP